jgi:site-specific recombinase XerD
VQSKTDEPISLPLLPEVREALTDYIENARPDHDCSQIFLKIPQPHTGPLSPVAFASIVRRLFNRAPFDNKGRRWGPHALRSSLATALLDEGNDYPTIQKALGHRSQNEAKSYVKVDVEHLRPFALAVPEPTTAFHDLLDGQGVLV